MNTVSAITRKTRQNRDRSKDLRGEGKVIVIAIFVYKIRREWNDNVSTAAHVKRLRQTTEGMDGKQGLTSTETS